MKALADGFDKVGVDSTGVSHACYKTIDGLEAWCSLKQCKPANPRQVVACVLCLTDTYLHDVDYP